MDKDEKIRKWVEGNLSDSEKKEFESSPEFESIKRMLNAVDNFKAPEYNPNEEYQRLSNQVFQKRKTISFFRKINPVLRVAAVFIFVLLVTYTVYDQLYTTQSTGEWIAEQKELYLPDSSFVSINKDSRIKISASTWDSERTVELQGEAFFQVKKGSQFSVKTRQGTVTVLGTEFGVKDRNNYYEVSCFSGAVKVATPQHKVELKPGSAFRIMNGKAENYTGNKSDEPTWLHGESSFKSVPLSFVINEFERQYNVSVKAKNIDLNRLFSGSFSNDNIEVALESITIPVNLDYNINGKKIVLSVESN